MPTVPGHLLVVDDNKVNRLLIGRNLEQLGHKLAFAENGRQALEKLHTQSFDLVLLDIEMPEVDGFQVLEQLARDHSLRHIPVVMITSVDELASVVKCIEMGAEDYLHKPINPVLLKARVEASLEKKRLRDMQRELIRKFATEEVAEELLKTGFSLGGKWVDATAMFCDMRGFTTIAESQSPAETIELLNDYFALMMDAIGGEGGIVNQMVGDGLMAIFGAPLPRPDHRRCAVRAAIQMIEMIATYSLDRQALGKSAIRVGIGIASGQMIAGYTGTQRRATYTCVGDIVNLAARLEAHTKVAGQPILIDESIRAALDASVPIEDVGMFEFKGKRAPAHIYAVKCQ